MRRGPPSLLHRFRPVPSPCLLPRFPARLCPQPRLPRFPAPAPEVIIVTDDDETAAPDEEPTTEELLHEHYL